MAFGGVALPGAGSAGVNPAQLSGGNRAIVKGSNGINGAVAEDEKKVNAGKDTSLEQGLSSVHGIVPTLQ